MTDDEGSSKLPKSYLPLVQACDSFPYDDPWNPQGKHWSYIYQFRIGVDHNPYGFILADTVKNMPWTEDFHINHKERSVILSPKVGDNAFTAALTNLVQKCIDEGTFSVIHGHHSEPYPIIGATPAVTLERYAANLFGIVSRGAHLTVYTNTSRGMKIWVPRRSPKLFTYPNCLDTTVAGGVAAGEGPLECIVREADEEASLSEEAIKQNMKAVGCLSYIHYNDARGGGETGLIAPNIIYTYDLEVEEDVICRQNDEEVKEFYLMTVDEVKDALHRGEFKTNSAVIMIDFFIRHGVITDENEKHYAEIIARMHRRLPFPTSFS